VGFELKISGAKINQKTHAKNQIKNFGGVLKNLRTPKTHYMFKHLSILKLLAKIEPAILYV
jgi:hypothetical protein